MQSSQQTSARNSSFEYHLWQETLIDALQIKKSSKCNYIFLKNDYIKYKKMKKLVKAWNWLSV